MKPFKQNRFGTFFTLLLLPVLVALSSTAYSQCTPSIGSGGTLCGSSSVTLYPQFSAPTPPNYQWYKGGAPISGATGASFVVTAGNAGSYSLLAIVNGCSSPAMSNTITVTDYT